MNGSGLLVMGLSAILLGVGSLVLLVTSGRDQRAQVGRSLAAVGGLRVGGPAAGSLPPASFTDRVLLPAVRRMALLGARVSPSGAAAKLQRRLDLAGVLTTVAATMRERARIRRQVRTLSAEGKLSAYILIGLPILLGLYEYAFRGEYFRPMYTTAPGIVMLLGTALSMTVGALWMNKLIKVEV